jgi:hypothetical protein
VHLAACNQGSMVFLLSVGNTAFSDRNIKNTME